MNGKNSSYIFISPINGEDPNLGVRNGIRHETVLVDKLESLSNTKFNGAIVVISPSCNSLHCKTISERIKPLNGHGPKQIISMSTSALSCNNSQIREHSKVVNLLNVIIK